MFQDLVDEAEECLYFDYSSIRCFQSRFTRSVFPKPSHGFNSLVILAYSEALAKELSEFLIRVLIVEPSGFRTEQNVLGYPFQVPSNPDIDYAPMRELIQSRLEALDLKQSGDPDKAVEVIVDVVRGEGVAQGRDWSLYLPLGREANSDLETKCGIMLNTVEEWREITDHLDVDPL